MVLDRIGILFLAIFLLGVAWGFPYRSHDSCSQCPPGTRVKRACSDDIDTVCVPCEDGTFTDKENYKPECNQCSKCSGKTYESKSCSSAYDTICTPCLDVPKGKSKNFLSSCLGNPDSQDIMVGDAPAPTVGEDEENLVDAESGKTIKPVVEKKKVDDEDYTVDDSETEDKAKDYADEKENDNGENENDKDNEKEKLAEDVADPQTEEDETRIMDKKQNNEDVVDDDGDGNDKAELDVDNEMPEGDEKGEDEIHEPEPELDSGLDDEETASKVDDEETASKVDDEETASKVDDEETASKVDDEETASKVDDEETASKVDDEETASKVDDEETASKVDDEEENEEIDNDEPGKEVENEGRDEEVDNEMPEGGTNVEGDEEKVDADGDALLVTADDENNEDLGEAVDNDVPDKNAEEQDYEPELVEKTEVEVQPAANKDVDVDDPRWGDEDENPNVEEDPLEEFNASSVDDIDEPGDEETEDGPGLVEKTEVKAQLAADGDVDVDDLSLGDEDENLNVKEDPLEEVTASSVDDGDVPGDEEMDGVNDGEVETDKENVEDDDDDDDNAVLPVDDKNNVPGINQTEGVDDEAVSDKIIDEQDDDPELEEKKGVEVRPAADEVEGIDDPTLEKEDVEDDHPEKATDVGDDNDPENEEMDGDLDGDGGNTDNDEDEATDNEEADDTEQDTNAVAEVGGVGALGTVVDSKPDSMTTSKPVDVEKDLTGEPEVGKVLQAQTTKATIEGGEAVADEEIEDDDGNAVLTERETQTTKIPDVAITVDAQETKVPPSVESFSGTEVNETKDVDVGKVEAVHLFPEEPVQVYSTSAKPSTVESATTTKRLPTSTDKEEEADDDHDEDEDDKVDAVVVEAVTTPRRKPTTKRIPTLEEMEAKYNKEQGDNGSGQVHIDLGPEHKDPYTVHGHAGDDVDGGHDDHVDDYHAEKSHHDSEEDKESKQRTAIIVGVAVGGVALFSLAFFGSRYCMRKGDFKVMKKVDGKDGEVIEFQPLSQTDSPIYEDPGSNGLYRKGPSMGPHSPRGHRKSAGNFQFPENETYAVPDKVKKTAARQTTPLLSESPSANETGLYRHGPKLGPPSPRIDRKGDSKFQFPTVAPTGPSLKLSSVPSPSPAPATEVFGSNNVSKPGSTSKPVEGLYRHGPRIGPPSPRMHRKQDGKFEFPAPGPTYPKLWTTPPSSPSHSNSSASVPQQPPSSNTDNSHTPRTDLKQAEGLYRHGPRIGPPSPRLHRKGDGKFQFPVGGPSDPSLWPSPSPSPSSTPTPLTIQLTAIGADTIKKSSSTSPHLEGLYRQGPRIGPPSPRMHRKQDGKFEFPIHKSTDYQDSKTLDSTSPEPREPLINGEKLKYIDDSTDDEYVNSVRDRHLPSRSHDPKLNKVTEETPPTSPSIKQTPPVSPVTQQSNGTTGSSSGSPPMKTGPKEHSSVSGSSQGSLATDVVNTLNQKQNGGEKKAKSIGSEENIEC